MSLISLARTGLFAGALLAPVLPAAPAQADSLQAQAQAAASQWDKAFNGGDMKQLGSLYTKDAQLITNAKPETGAGIEAFFAGMRAKGFEGHKITVQSAQAKGDLVIATGRWEITGPGDGGAKKTFEGNWVNVLERQGGELKAALHTWN